MVVEQRYTLTLPTEVYEELRTQAEKRSCSIKEMVRMCLKVGLVAIKYEEDPATGLFIKEKLSDKDGVVETRLIIA
jgi:hypothetical protein